MWKHKNFINLQLYAPPNPSQLTINWDSNITAVIGKNLFNGTTGDVTFTNGEAANTGANDGIDYTFEVTLNSGYVLDTVTLNNSSSSLGVVKSQTDTSFIITGGNGGIGGTITLTSKVAKIQTADVLKSTKTHIQQAYTALENKSATIPTYKTVENLKSTIESISTGVDTSDATATDSDILSPKTAYARGEKLTGGIPTYNGEYEDISSGETWLLNDWLNFENGQWITLTASFTSNGQTFSSIKYKYAPTAYAYLNYDDTWVFDSDDGGGWRNEAYRMITFETTPTGDLLTWLQANGTKQ